MWDEVSLDPHIDYCNINDQIVGFEDFAESKIVQPEIVRTDDVPNIADHSLTFLIRGLKSAWKYPAAFYFVDSATKTEQLVQCISTILGRIIDVGLIPLITVCDQARTNIAAVNKLRGATGFQKGIEKMICTS